jgi:DNA-binding NtrC family response regulator
VKLLRVLQEETIRRLGDTKDIKVDVRIIAATHRDLTADVKAAASARTSSTASTCCRSRSRRCASRREDVNLLIDHFIARNNARLGTSIRGVSHEARKLLLEYAWPGNVRELENTIERAMVLAEADDLAGGDLPERIRDALDPVQVHLASGELSIKKTTAAIEQILIRRALHEDQGQPHARGRAARDQPPGAALQDQGLQDHRPSITLGRNGHIKQVSVPAPYDGKPVGLCIAHSFDKIQFPPYAGDTDAVESWNVELVKPKGR